MSDTIKLHRKIKSFVLRKGRMTPGQQRGWDEHWDKCGLKLEQGMLNLDATFGRKAPTFLEIGYGMGQSLVAMAKSASEKNFIGVEVYRPGVGSMLNDAHSAKISNIKTYCDDAIDVLNQCIPDSSLSRVQIYFPDPWHKKRHNKRRLIQPDFIDCLRQKLTIKGIIHIATDWGSYAEQMMEILSDTDGFINKAGEYAFAERPEYRPLTKFEKRGELLGHGVWDLLFEKVN